ncbi:MAG: exo-alpha-sialidase, partial [Clostridiales bacterium]|nr:exo-alpha-sialidase [Clostridiales bacterium]
MKITSITPMNYTKGELNYFQFIRGGVGADCHQGPSFYQFKNGGVQIRWGAYDIQECSGDTASLYCTTYDMGITWSDPQIINFLGGTPEREIVQLKNTNKAISFGCVTRHNLVVDEKTKKVTSHSNYFNASTRVYLRRSDDGGDTFGMPEEISYLLISGNKELANVGFYAGVDNAFQLESGRIIVAYTFMDPERIGDSNDVQAQHYTGACILSDDEGKTWRRSQEIVSTTQRGVMELQMVETAPNKIFALFRTKSGYVYQTISDDGGETWSESIPSPLTAPESMTRMIKLKNGNILVTRNSISSKTQYPRHPITASISTDGGVTWS